MAHEIIIGDKPGVKIVVSNEPDETFGEKPTVKVSDVNKGKKAIVTKEESPSDQGKETLA